MRDNVFVPLHKIGLASDRRHGEVGEVCGHLSNWRYKALYTVSFAQCIVIYLPNSRFIVPKTRRIIM
jgi:hypothetical protein